MTSATLKSGTPAKDLANGAVVFRHRSFTFSGAANTDNDTIEICRLPPRSTIINVLIRATDLDSGTDVEIDLGLNPAPGGTVADADVVADGLTTFTTAGLTQLTLAPTITNGVIVAGAGIKTHAELESVLYATLIDQGDATSGTLYFQVLYTNDDGFENDTVVNS